METRIRRKLSMAERALAFELAQPSGDASHQSLVDRLQQLTTQAIAVVHQEREGGVGERAARARLPSAPPTGSSSAPPSRCCRPRRA